MRVCIYLTPPSFLFLDWLPKIVKEHSLAYYLPIDRGKIDIRIPYGRLLVRCEMQTATFNIWTRVVDTISYDDNEAVYVFFDCSVVLNKNMHFLQEYL